MAKALAKSAEARYAEAAEFARDLRDSLKQIQANGGAQPGAAAPAQPPPDAVVTQPLARTLPDERRAVEVAVATEPAPALGLSKAFDSLEATAKLAAHTGISVEAIGGATEARARVGEMRKLPGWSRRDWITFAASVAAAVVVGALIIFI